MRVCQAHVKSDERDSLSVTADQPWDIYRHAESSVSLFAALANLSGPIPTSRGKKTFDKRPDIPAVGPQGFAQGFLNLRPSPIFAKETNGPWRKFDTAVVNDGRINFDWPSLSIDKQPSDGSRNVRQRYSVC